MKSEINQPVSISRTVNLLRSLLNYFLGLTLARLRFHFALFFSAQANVSAWVVP